MNSGRRYLLFAGFEDDSRPLGLNGGHAVHFVLNFARLGSIDVGQFTPQSSGHHQWIRNARFPLDRRVQTVAVHLHITNRKIVLLLSTLYQFINHYYSLGTILSNTGTTGMVIDT